MAEKRKVGGQPGNRNAHKAKPWVEALKKTLARKHGSVSQGLEKIAESVVACAEIGEWQAIQEIANRLDGKPAQQQILTGIDDGPIQIQEMSREEIHDRILAIASELDAGAESGTPGITH